jgi:hypothetical protein
MFFDFTGDVRFNQKLQMNANENTQNSTLNKNILCRTRAIIMKYFQQHHTTASIPKIFKPALKNYLDANCFYYADKYFNLDRE